MKVLKFRKSAFSFTLVLLLSILFADSGQAKTIEAFLGELRSGWSRVQTVGTRLTVDKPDSPRFVQVDYLLSSSQAYLISFESRIQSPGGLGSPLPFNYAWSFDGSRYMQSFSANRQVDVDVNRFPQQTQILGPLVDPFLFYSFLRTSSSPIGLKELSDSDIWNLLVTRLIESREVLEDNGRKHFIAKFRDCWDPDLELLCEIEVVFDITDGFVPVKLESSNLEHGVFKRLELKNLQKLNSEHGGGAITVPTELLISRSIFKGTMTGNKPFPFLQESYFYSDWRVSDNVDDGEFVVDVLTGEVIFDKPNDIFLSIPK